MGNPGTASRNRVPTILSPAAAPSGREKSKKEAQTQKRQGIRFSFGMSDMRSCPHEE
jgi:hypothetical protein